MGCLASGAHLGTWMIFRDEFGQAHEGLSASGEETQHLHYRVQGGEDGHVKEAEEEGRERQGRSGTERGVLLEAHGRPCWKEEGSSTVQTALSGA